MKITFIDRYFYPDLQATSCILTDLASYLVKKHKITVISGYPSNFSEKIIKQKFFFGREIYKDIENIRIWNPEFPRKYVILRWTNYIYFIICAFLIASFLPKQDLTVVMTSPPLANISAYLLKKIKKIPYLYICQDIIPESAIVGGLIEDGILARYINILNMCIMENSVKIVAVGERMKQRLTDKGVMPDRIQVISNWTNIGLIKQLPKDNPFSRKYNIYNKFVVMHAGNIGLSHNLEDLVYAAKYLLEFRDILFLIIGSGANKERIVSLVKSNELNNIIFLPFQEQDVLSQVLASSDISMAMLKRGLCGYVIPSKIYTILASGRAVIAVVEEESEIADIIKEANCGVVVEPGNPKLLSEIIVNLYKNRNLLNIYATNALTYANEKNFMQTSLEMYDTLFRDLQSFIKVGD
jgi:glycosyltransferase involved in cell wall biosynthesis